MKVTHDTGQEIRFGWRMTNVYPAPREPKAGPTGRRGVPVARPPTPPRYRMRRELSAEGRRVDAVAGRAIGRGRAGAGDDPSVRGRAGVSDRLAALEAARADLARLDRT